jgi:putative phosphoesterase
MKYMKIGIMSDSHDHAENIKKSMQIFKERNVDFVIHLGDYVNPASVMLCKGINLIGIFGNNDGDKYRLMNVFHEIHGELRGDFCQINKNGLTCACYHGTEPQLTDALIECGKYDVVMFGHTHECVNKKIKRTLVLNPGTVHGFWKKATIMIFNTQTMKAEVIIL